MEVPAVPLEPLYSGTRPWDLRKPVSTYLNTRRGRRSQEREFTCTHTGVHGRREHPTMGEAASPIHRTTMDYVWETNGLIIRPGACVAGARQMEVRRWNWNPRAASC